LNLERRRKAASQRPHHGRLVGEIALGDIFFARAIGAVARARIRLDQDRHRRHAGKRPQGPFAQNPFQAGIGWQFSRADHFLVLADDRRVTGHAAGRGKHFSF